MKRANYLPAPHFFNLNQAVLPIVEAFGHGVYLVGSSLERRDYRDVDVRLILEDDKFDHLFPGVGDSNPSVCALWSIMCASFSLYLQQHTGLPIDFQIQRQSMANEQHDGARSALGLFLHYPGGG